MNLHRLFKSISILTVLVCTGIFFVHPVFAAPVESSAFATFAASAGFAAGPSVIVIIARLIRTFISFLGVIAVVIVLYGGFMYMTAGGNDDRVKKAKKIIVNGIIGLVIVLLSFTIAQFIVSKLVGATSDADISAYCLKNPTDPTCKKSPPFPPAVPPFTLNPPTSLIQCAASIRNLKLVFVFSKSVKDEKGIHVTQSGTDVPGVFSFSGQKVTFVPNGLCDAPNATLHCFSKGSTFHVEVDSTQVKSSNDIALTCKTVGGVNPCSFDFTTGSAVDLKPPQEVSFVDPKEGGKAILGLSKPLQVKTIDDSGVASVEFYAIDETVAIDTSSAPVNAVVTNGLTSASFNGSWLPVGLVTNASYPLWATATDCAGNTKTSSKVSLMLRAPNCDNKVQDAAAPYGETGSCKSGEACNCGGSSTSQYYCGLCEPAPCTSSAQCSTGYCISGKCQDVAVIQSVSPDNGAMSGLVTITGSGFGTVPGTVEFLGTEKDNTNKIASAYVCGFRCFGGTKSGQVCTEGGNQCTGGACGPDVKWSNKEIIVQIPDGAIDGPLKIFVPSVGANPAQFDRTDDAVGPAMSKFDVNAIKRPGLCSVTPESAEVNTPFTLTGLLFGASQGSSTIYLTNFEAKSTDWKTTLLAATVPGVVNDTYNAQVFTGDYFCLNASGAKVDPAVTCFSNADCTDVNPAYTCGMSWCSESLKFCQNNEVCGASGGKCVDIRVGSNKMKFVATNKPTAEKPTISYLDTGWKACNGGANAGKQCTKDDDCGGSAGSCKTEQNWGPSGQYVTVFGSGFGTAKGYVKFTNTTSNESINGDILFPKACGDSFWHNDSITVKVPHKADGSAIAVGSYNVSVVPQSGIQNETAAKPFEVVAGKPTPGICLLDPSAGPVGKDVKILGENFGDTKGTVIFNPSLSMLPGDWTGLSVGSFSVPVGAKSGPLVLKDAALNQSNSMNFTVGNCKDTPAICAAGQTCCGDGSCSAEKESCPSEGPKTAHFAYKVSTSPLPIAPIVIKNCTDPKKAKPSPSPSLEWSEQKDICVSSAVTASFSVAMDPSTLNATNIKIQKCTSESNGVCAAAGWQDVPGAFQIPSAIAFQWSPTTVFDTNTLYQVIIKGASAANGGVKSKASGLTPGASMAQDFPWQFRTSTSDKDCGIGSVVVSPANYLATNANEAIGYLSQLLSNQDSCVVLSCNPYKLRWNSDSWNATFSPGHTITKPDMTADPALGSCSASVFPDANTLPGFPAHISSVVINDGKNPHATGTGNLNIALTDPKVSDYFPNCSSACGNAMPWVAFNVPMGPSLTNAGAVRIFKCQNSLCDKNQETLQNIISGITPDAATYKAKIGLNAPLIQNTWYRVVVAGWVKSSTQAPLSNAGSNFGTPENKFFPGDFSWRFKTKDSAISCVIDRVGVSPKSATLNFIGQRQEFSAMAYGAPDDCSVTGQALQSTGWSGWGATDTPNKTGVASYVTGVGVTDHKTKEITSFMLNNGSLALASTLPKICAGNCLFTGNPVKAEQPVCGNSVVETGESCDTGNIIDGDGCSGHCLKEGTNAPTCGNAVMDTNEQCDDSNTVDGDGCSAKCLYEGSTAIKSVCGDGVLDRTNTNGGEACDDGNTKDGDGCTSNCLLDGSIIAFSSARCGDGAIGTGETCDDSNAVDGDGCSSLCLNEGTVTGTDATKAQCGNGVTNSPGEDAGCDLGIGFIAPGCSKKCLKMGSSPNYLSPSICGNGGTLETGEQCEAAAGASYVVGPYGVAEVSEGAPVEVEKDATKATFGYAISNVQVTVGGKTGTGEFKLLCACEADNQCGTKSGDPTKTLGCGASKCCYERPSITASAPGNDAKDVCRNAAVSVTFDEEMDSNSFGSVDTDNNGKISAEETDPNLQLELITMKSAAGLDVAVTAANCPYYAQPVGFQHAKNLFVYVWNWVKDFFGQEALANATTQCFVPTTYEQASGTNQVYLRYTERLLPLATYKLTVKTKNGNAKGVLSKNQVSICLGDNGTSCQFVSQTNTFTTGADICLLDVVQTTDDGIIPAPPSYLSKSAGYYSKTNETHDFSVKPLSYRKNTGLLEEISSIPNLYAWTWSWGAPVKDTETKLDILGIVAASTTINAQYKALGKNGSGDVIATATITADTVNKVSTSGSGVAGHVSEVAFLCENPWPDLAHGVPFVETGANTNFSLFYCRDIGKPEEGKKLPALALPPTDATPDQKLIHTDVLKELVFHVEGTKDSVGVRVLSNPKYLSPMAWFKAQGFTGTPKTTTLDGYEAVQTGTTIYASAANRNDSNLYSNIYVISFNADAGKDAQQIFDLVLKNFHLNANDTGAKGVSHVGLCKSGSVYMPITGPFIACTWDGDCFNQCKPDGKCSVTDTVCDPKLGNAECVADANVFCDADKQKLIRDTKRLTDMTNMIATFEKYGNVNGRCAVTKSQKCVVSNNNIAIATKQNPACPGTETCVPSYPTVQAGTFIPSMSNSIWPSWNSTLGNAVGGALPTDPLNQFWAQCKNVGAGYDSATCWNSTQGKFVCPDGSHVYGYQNQGGEDYILSTELEYGAVAWVDKIDQTASDHATIQASYGINKAPGGLQSGFIIAPQYCNATIFGSSTICGDGVVGAGEICDGLSDVCTKGDANKIGLKCTAASVVADCGQGGICAKTSTISIACTNNAGFITASCKSDCTRFLTQKEAENNGATCKPFACGNGVKDPGEVCDDGVALNGTYGHCAKDCKTASDFSCGDGNLAGNEQCDCGTPTNFPTLPSASWAKSNNNCTTYNGGYDAGGKNCTIDCKAPGPMCGDTVVNDSTEVCDKNTETYAGALNIDGTKCSAPSGCTVAACPKSKICTAGTNVGSMCTADAECGAGGKCSADQYDLTRTRTCKNYGTPPIAQACSWISSVNSGWGDCAGGPQQCGNGKKEGTEECDDANNSDNDSCTNECKVNVCGDNKVNVGIESCDSGGANGTVCNAAYGASCNFCNKFCQYKTQSGPYCGDGIMNGNEFCDGTAIMDTCVKNKDGQQEMISQGLCDPADENKVSDGTNIGLLNGVSTAWVNTANICPSGFTCRKTGVCNGGSFQTPGENGKLCSNTGGGGSGNNCDGYCENSKTTCNWSGDCNTAANERCIGAGTCVMPTCAANCGSSCPTAFQKVSLQVQGNVAEAQPSDSISLYSLNNSDGKTPDRANLLLPACRVGTGITADVTTGSALANSGNNATIIAASYKDAAGNYIYPETETGVLTIGNSFKLPLPSKFMCHDVPFALPLTVTLNPPLASSVSFKNFEFTYCPLN